MRFVLLSVLTIAGAAAADPVASTTGALPLPATSAPAAPGSATVALTLTEALRLAAMRNEDPAIAQERVRAAEASLRGVNGRMLPQISANGNASRSGTDGVSGQTDRIGGSIGVEMNLLDLETWMDRRAAQESLRAERFRAEDVRRSLAFQVADAFHGRLAFVALVDAAERRVKVANQIVERARARFSAGLDDRQSVTRAELDLATAEQTLTTRRNDLLTSGLTLAQIIGDGPDLALRPLADPATTAVPVGTFEELVGLARRNRPDVLALERDLAASRASARGPRADFVPVISAGASVESSFTDPIGGNDESWEAHLAARWVLYDGGSRYARIEASDSAERIAELQLARSLRQVSIAIRSGQASLDTAEASVRQGQARLRLARQNADEVKAKADAGLTTPIDAADALAELFEAEADLATRIFARARSALRVRELVGAWPEERP